MHRFGGKAYNSMKKMLKLLCFVFFCEMMLIMAGCNQQQAGLSESPEEQAEEKFPTEEQVNEQNELPMQNEENPVDLVLLWHEHEIYLGQVFGDIPDWGDTVEVFKDGKDGELVENFTVKSEEPETMSAEISGAGQICLTKLKSFEGRNIPFTITYKGQEYIFLCNDDSWVAEETPQENGQGTQTGPAMNHQDTPYADEYVKFTKRQYTDEELQAFVDADLSFQDACDKLSTVSDVVQYLYLRGYQFAPDDAGTEASTRYRLNSGACVGDSALLNALLEGDYDEQGYVYIFYARGEHVFDYFVKNGVYYYCDLVGGPFNDRGADPKKNPVCHITTDPSTLYEAWKQLEPNDLDDSNSDMYLAIMYMTAYCGDPTMPTTRLIDTPSGTYAHIPLSPAEKKSQQILFLRDGYTFEF